MGEESRPQQRIALAENRELDLLAQMLEREGAETVRCPLVSILDVPDPAPIEAWLRRVVNDRVQHVIFYTGEGVRRLTGFAERAGLKDEFIAALARIHKITRGPKPVRALRELGLEPDLTAAAPTTEGLIASLDGLDLKGRTVGVQLYGQEPNVPLAAFLVQKGAAVDTVAPYVYLAKTEDSRVVDLIGQMDAGRINVIAFTSSPQVRRLLDVAKEQGISDALQRGLVRSKVVAVGPVVAAELARWDVRVDAVAPAPFSLKPLVRTIRQLA